MNLAESHHSGKVQDCKQHIQSSGRKSSTHIQMGQEVCTRTSFNGQALAFSCTNSRLLLIRMTTGKGEGPRTPSRSDVCRKPLSKPFPHPVLYPQTPALARNRCHRAGVPDAVWLPGWGQVSQGGAAHLTPLSVHPPLPGLGSPREAWAAGLSVGQRPAMRGRSLSLFRTHPHAPEAPGALPETPR